MADGGTAVKEKGPGAGPPAAAASGADVLKVFLSYSRADSDFAEDLLVALRTCGFAPYLDKHDIAPGEPWEDRLQRLIQAADTVVYVISPDSIKSERCRWEVEKTEALNKRLLPVVWRKVDEAAVPERLKRLNYTFFSGTGESFAKGLAALVTALNTDLDWIREYTRLGDLAHGWHSRGRPTNRLLTGTDIGDAKTWMERHPSGAPEPSALQREFIAESDRAETARASQESQRLRTMARTQRRVWYILGVTALLLIALFASSGWGLRELAVREAQNFETLARDAFDKEQYDLALRYALAGLPGQGASPLAYWSPRLDDQIRRAAVANRLRGVLGGHKSVPAARWTEDGTRLVTWSYNDRIARLWDSANRKVIKDLSFGEPPTDIAIDNLWLGGDRILAAARDSNAAPQLWNAHTGDLVKELSGAAGPVEAAPFFLGASRIITWNRSEGIARLWDSDGAQINTFGDASEKVVGFAVFDSFDRLVTWGERAGSARLWNLKTGGLVRMLQEQPGRVVSVVLVGGSQLLSADQGNRRLELWDAATGNHMAELGSPAGPSRGVQSEPGGDRIITWGLTDGSAKLWDAHTGQLVKELAGNQSTLAAPVRLYGKGRRILTAAQGDRSVRLWDAHTGDFVKELSGHEAPVTRISLNDAGTRAATWSDNSRSVRLWDAGTGEFVAELVGHDAAVTRVEFSPDGNWVMTTGDNERSSRLWNAVTGAFVAELGGHNGKIRPVRWTKDGTKILTTADNDDAVRIWNATSGAPIDVIRARTPVVSVYLLPDGNTLATTSTNEENVRLWEIGSGILADSLRLPFSWLDGDRWYLTGDRIIVIAGPGHSVSDRFKIAFLSYPTLSLVKVLPQPHDVPLADAVVSRKADRLVTWTRYARPARLWDTRTGDLMAELSGHAGAIAGVYLSRDGSRVITRASGDKTARVWDAKTGALSAELGGSATPIAGITLSENGNRIITRTDNDPIARLWDGTTGHLVKELRGHTATIAASAVNENGTRAVTRAETGTGVLLWDAQTGELISELTGHDSKIVGLLFSKDGTRLTTRDEAGHSIQLWDTKQGKLIARLAGHDDPINTVGPPLYTTRILTRSQGSARLWEAETGKLVAELSNQSGSMETSYFPEDPAWVATWSKNSPVARLWDLRTGSLIFAPDTRGVGDGLSENADRSLIASWARQPAAEIWSSAGGAGIAVLKNSADSRVVKVFFGKDATQAFVLGDTVLSRWDLGRALTKSGEELRDLVCNDPEVDRSVRVFTDQEMRKISRAELRDPCDNYGVFSREFHKRMIRGALGYAGSKFARD